MSGFSIAAHAAASCSHALRYPLFLFPDAESRLLQGYLIYTDEIQDL